MLLGSTEWVEKHEAELQQHAVVYINSDGNGRGFLDAERLAHARALRQRRRAGHPGSRDEPHRLEAAAGAAHRSTARPKREPRRAAAPTCASARWARARTTRRSSSTPASPTLNHRLRRRGRRRHLPLDLRRLLLLHALQRHRLRLRPRAGADRGHGGDSAGRRGPAAVRIHEPRGYGVALHERAADAAAPAAGRRSAIRTAPSTRALFKAVSDPHKPSVAPGEEGRCRRP